MKSEAPYPKPTHLLRMNFWLLKSKDLGMASPRDWLCVTLGKPFWPKAVLILDNYNSYKFPRIMRPLWTGIFWSSKSLNLIPLLFLIKG